MRPGDQEQQPAFFGDLLGATSTREPFRRSSCTLSDLQDHTQASVLSHCPGAAEKGPWVKLGGRAGGCTPRASSLQPALPLPYIPQGIRKVVPWRHWGSVSFCHAFLPPVFQALCRGLC